MGSPALPSPADIAAEAFGALLGRYPDVIAAVSAAKGAKPGQQSLAALDAFRYETAPGLFGGGGGGSGGRSMARDDVLALVAWKLRHGTFRPTLLKLVASNPAAAVEETVRAAVAAYRAGQDADKTAAALAAVQVLSQLRGIGPATASLLVAVHFAADCIFFSDEAYAWLCGGAAHSRPSKYSVREYEDLARATARLLARLPPQYGAQDVEQVAYVLLHDKKSGPGAKAPSKATAKPAKTAEPAEATPAEATPAKESKKRKEPPTVAAPSAGRTRRSSRRQQAA